MPMLSPTTIERVLERVRRENAARPARRPRQRRRSHARRLARARLVPRLRSVPVWPPSPLWARAHVPRQKLSPRGHKAGSQRKYEGAGRVAWRTRGEGEGDARGGRGACGRTCRDARGNWSRECRTRAPKRRERRLVFLITGRAMPVFRIPRARTVVGLVMYRRNERPDRTLSVSSCKCGARVKVTVRQVWRRRPQHKG